MEPEHEGNVGSIARLMKNFGLSELWLVNPKVRIGEEARAFASHARNILENAVTVESLDEAFSDVGCVVGTTSILAKHSSNIMRTAITPQEFADTVWAVKGRVALLFGRESTGLSNKELAKCDLVVTIQSSPEYKTLNVALASAIIFYELWKARLTSRRGYVEEASREYRERLLMLFSQMCQRANLPAHKERLAREAFKNVISRAFISKREATLLMGVFREFLERTLGMMDPPLTELVTLFGFAIYSGKTSMVTMVTHPSHEILTKINSSRAEKTDPHENLQEE